MAKKRGPLKCGVIGLGMGNGHAAAYMRDPNTELVAIADLNEERLARVKEEKNVEMAFTNAEEMLEKARQPGALLEKAEKRNGGPEGGEIVDEDYGPILKT